MNYFTKDWYGEMQVYGFLTFPETIEDWEENLAYYESEGINYKENLQREIEDRKEDLLRFLPASFHPYILDYSIRSEYPTPELRAMAQQWEENYRKRMELIWQDYNAIYLANKHLLPENVVQLHEKSLHDATVKAYEVPSDDVLVLTLDCSGGNMQVKRVKVKDVESDQQKLEMMITASEDTYTTEIYSLLKEVDHVVSVEVESR